MCCSKFPHRPQSLKTPALATPSKLSHGYPSNALVTTHNTLESVVSFALFCILVSCWVKGRRCAFKRALSRITHAGASNDALRTRSNWVDTQKAPAHLCALIWRERSQRIQRRHHQLRLTSGCWSEGERAREREGVCRYTQSAGSAGGCRQSVVRALLPLTPSEPAELPLLQWWGERQQPRE